MKLIIQIPCYNESAMLPIVLNSLPKKMTGFDSIEWLVIDDGSNDNTIEIAKENGVDHIIRHTRNCGLARTFMTGINACLSLGADVIVNIDGDYQYDGRDIPKIVRPILEGTADIVIGSRPIDTLSHFSYTKKIL